MRTFIKENIHSFTFNKFISERFMNMSGDLTRIWMDTFDLTSLLADGLDFFDEFFFAKCRFCLSCFSSRLSSSPSLCFRS